MATIFPREEKAEALFGEILKNPEACRRLMDTFNDSLDMADVLMKLSKVLAWSAAIRTLLCRSADSIFLNVLISIL